MCARFEIASRTLKRKSGGVGLKVKIYKPEKESKGEWSCSFKIGNDKKKAHGIDSMQALVLAIDGIKRTLSKIEDIEDLYWIDGEGFLGFPAFVPMYLSDKKISDIEAIINQTKQY